MTLHLPRHLGPRDVDYVDLTDSRFRDSFGGRQDSLMMNEPDEVHHELRSPTSKFEFDTDHFSVLPQQRVEYHDKDYAFREIHPRTKMRILRGITAFKSILRGERDVPY